MDSADRILEILDEGAERFAVPILDNAYLALAATRVTLFCSASDWALVFEVFGYDTRASLPSLQVATLASRLHARDPVTSYVTPEAHAKYLAENPHNDARFFEPVDEGDWQDDDEQQVAQSATSLLLRGKRVAIPNRADYAALGISLASPDAVFSYELTRALAATHRAEVLALPEELRVSVPPELVQVLQLDEWTHPDLVDESPSDVESIRHFAQVLASGDVGAYRAVTPPNTHWSNWPNGGLV